MSQRLVSGLLLIVIPLLLTGCSFRVPGSFEASSSASSEQSQSQARSQASGQPILAEVGNYLGADPKALTSAITANREKASQMATTWQKDAVLYHFSVKFPADLRLGQATEVFTYGSASDAYNWWTLTASEKTGKRVRALIPKEDYLGTSLKPIPLNFWKTNYVTAFQLADAAGGADFRKTHPGSDVTISLMVGQPKEYLWWTVEYQSATSKPYKILVNPANSEVLNDAQPTGQ